MEAAVVMAAVNRGRWGGSGVYAERELTQYGKRSLKHVAMWKHCPRPSNDNGKKETFAQGLRNAPDAPTTFICTQGRLQGWLTRWKPKANTALTLMIITKTPDTSKKCQHTFFMQTVNVRVCLCLCEQTGRAGACIQIVCLTRVFFVSVALC